MTDPKNVYCTPPLGIARNYCRAICVYGDMIPPRARSHHATCSKKKKRLLLYVHECSVTVTTVGKGAEHERERQKRIHCRLLANKHQYILGKYFGHSKWILLSLPLGPTDTLLLLRELAFLVPFALLLAFRRPDKRR